MRVDVSAPTSSLYQSWSLLDPPGVSALLFQDGVVGWMEDPQCTECPDVIGDAVLWSLLLPPRRLQRPYPSRRMPVPNWAWGQSFLHPLHRTDIPYEWRAKFIQNLCVARRLGAWNCRGYMRSGAARGGAIIFWRVPVDEDTTSRRGCCGCHPHRKEIIFEVFWRREG